MKKIKFQKKLSLNKETIANLNNEQMNVIKGGGPTQLKCPTYWTCPPSTQPTALTNCAPCGPATTTATLGTDC